MLLRGHQVHRQAWGRVLDTAKGEVLVQGHEVLDRSRRGPTSPPGLQSLAEKVSPFTVHIGFKSDLDMPAFLAQTELNPVSIEKVNLPKIWSLITCVKH